MTTATRSVAKPTNFKPNQPRKSKETVKEKKPIARNLQINPGSHQMAGMEIGAKKCAVFDRLKSAQAKPHAVDTFDLLDKYRIDYQIYLEAELKFAAIYPVLIKGVDYAPEDLLGHDYWAELTAVGRRVLILCLKHMAEVENVPLVDVSAFRDNEVSFQAV